MTDPVLRTPNPAATISECGQYRYDLTRHWGDGPLALWIMLNPSTADAIQDDPTIRRCIGFSRREGMGGLVVCNLFAYRATQPSVLLEAAGAGIDPVGPENVSTLRFWMIAPNVELVVCAWGAWPLKVMIRRPAIEMFAEKAGRALWCLGRTKTGAPRHPLYVRGDQPFEPNSFLAQESLRD